MLIYEAQTAYRLVQPGSAPPFLDSPEKVTAYLYSAMLERPTQETLWVIGLTVKNQAIARELVTVGSITNTLLPVREIFRPLILMSAASFVVCHNHPSGSIEPSQADIQITRNLREAANLMGIALIDHVIFAFQDLPPAPAAYYSFRSAGYL